MGLFHLSFLVSILEGGSNMFKLKKQKNKKTTARQFSKMVEPWKFQFCILANTYMTIFLILAIPIDTSWYLIKVLNLHFPND